MSSASMFMDLFLSYNSLSNIMKSNHPFSSSFSICLYFSFLQPPFFYFHFSFSFWLPFLGHLAPFPYFQMCWWKKKKATGNLSTWTSWMTKFHNRYLGLSPDTNSIVKNKIKRIQINISLSCLTFSRIGME